MGLYLYCPKSKNKIELLTQRAGINENERNTEYKRIGKGTSRPDKI